MKKFVLLLLVVLFVALPLMATEPKAMADVKTVQDVPVSEKGFSFDPASPYLPPVPGFAEHMEADGAVYSVYVPDDLDPWRPGVIILVPDGTGAAEFALSDLGRTWMSAADEYGFALGFAEPAEGGWNVTGDPQKRDDVDAVEDVYTQMRSKSQTLELPFTMDKSRVSLVGYEEGGAMALAVAAGSSSAFCGVIAIDQVGADLAYLEKLAASYCFPFPADGMRCKEEVALPNSALAMPVWFINSYDEGVYEYYREKNSTDSWTQNDVASVAYDSSDTVRAVWRSEGLDNPDPAVLWTEFLSIHTRPLGVEGGHLAYAMEFDTRADGRGYIYSEEVVDGLVRRWMTYVPESYDPSTPAPMVLVLHGYTATMYALAEESRWCDVAEENGIITVFAQGYPNPEANTANIPAPSWMVPALFGDAEGADDVSFLAHVVDVTKENYNIDDSRVYGTGHSNGCAMTLALASVHPEIFAAIAPIGYAAEGLTDDLGGTIMPLSLYYGQYDSAVNADGVAMADAYWTGVNGLAGAETTERTSEDGRFTTKSYLTDSGVPLVEFTEVANSAHSYFPAESWRIWNEFFTHYTREGATVYYDGVAVN